MGQGTKAENIKADTRKIFRLTGFEARKIQKLTASF
jgi:hypothetical protein